MQRRNVSGFCNLFEELRELKEIAPVAPFFVFTTTYNQLGNYYRIQHLHLLLQQRQLMDKSKQLIHLKNIDQIHKTNKLFVLKQMH